MTSPLAIDIKNTFFGANHANAAIIGNNPGSLISTLLPNIIVFAGLIFFAMILFAGFNMVIGAGKQQSAQDAAKARAALTWGVAGFLIVVTGYFILQLVGSMVGVDFTKSWSF